MVSFKELKARISTDLRFNKHELTTLFIAILVTAFIFSFRDWGGDQFDLATGVKNIIILILVVAFSFSFRFSCQKIYALSQGYKATFKIWWAGIIIALVTVFLTLERFPLITIGGISVALMVRQRLGEYRYGFSHFDNAIISFWGIIGNMVLAILFAIGLHFSPQSYLFTKGLWLNLLMGFFALLPLPQLDGLNIFFGSKVVYVLAFFMVLLAAVLLLSQTTIGLIITIILGILSGIIFIMKGSEK